MRKKTQNAPTVKQVHWHESVQDNEGKTNANEQKVGSVRPEKRFFSPQLIEGIKATITEHFENGTYKQLEEILNKYSLRKKIKILSVDNYDLFRYAASTHDVKALNFIISIVPQEIAYNMVHYANFLPFKSFLIYSCTLEELNRLDRQSRIEGLKTFLKIDHENIQKTFDTFEARLSQKDPVKESLKRDFITALTELREEGIIAADKFNIIEESMSNSEHESSKSYLLKHLEAPNDASIDTINLPFYSTADYAAFNSTEKLPHENYVNSEDISGLVETAKKAGTSPDASSTSYKTL